PATHLRAMHAARTRYRTDERQAKRRQSGRRSFWQPEWNADAALRELFTGLEQLVHVRARRVHERSALCQLVVRIVLVTRAEIVQNLLVDLERAGRVLFRTDPDISQVGRRIGLIGLEPQFDQAETAVVVGTIAVDAFGEFDCVRR